jgi:hypothetical protein
MTSDEELEKMAEGYAEANEDDNHYSGFLAGFRAAEKMMADRCLAKQAEVISVMREALEKIRDQEPDWDFPETDLYPVQEIASASLAKAEELLK